MHSRLSQVLVAVLLGALFFGVASLNAKPVYATNTTVKVYKFNDLDGDGVKDSNESYLQNWYFTATFLNDPGCSSNCPTYSTKTGTTNSSGYVIGTGTSSPWSLHRGTWQICEIIKSGWTPTGSTNAQGCQTLSIPWYSGIPTQYFYYGNRQYAPTVSKTATATYKTTHTWTIEKSVDPTSQSDFMKDVLPWTWTVNVSESSVEGDYAVTGQILVTNTNPSQSIAGTLVDKLDDAAQTAGMISGCTGDGVLYSAGTLTIGAGKTATCTYTAGPSGKTATKNQVTFTTNSVDYKAEASLTWAETVVNGTATVTDNQIGLNEGLTAGQGPWTRTGPGSHTCSANPDDYAGDGSYSGSVDNTATITASNGQTDNDDASTAYTCYGPVVSKTAATEWFRTYTWTIDKSVAPSAHTGYPGDTFASTYAVAVDQTVVDSGYRAFGTISVANPAGAPGSITVDVADQVGASTATVDCGSGLTSLTVAAGSTGTCSYTMNLSDATDLTNAATVTFKGVGFPATAAVDFGEPTVVGYPTINVSDFFNGGGAEAIGSAAGDKTFTYDRPFACPTEQTAYTNGVYSASFPNVAKINETGQQDDAAVTVDCELKAGLGDLVWLDTNLNGQQDAGEPGVPGVTVELLQGGSVIDTTTTDANGNYSFTGLEPGTYTVRFSTTGLTSTDNGPDVTDSDADPVLGETTTTLDAGEYDPTLDAGYIPAALGDFVWEDTNANGAQDESGTGVANVTVNLKQGGSVIGTTTTDANGKYLFDNLTAGEYEVCFVVPAGYDGFTSANAANDDVDSDAAVGGATPGCTGPITLDFGETDLTWDAGLVVSPLAQLGDYVWEDTNANGEQDESGTGVPNVTVNLMQGGSIIGTTTTDADGKYLFTKLTAGEYEVCFVRPLNYDFTTQGATGSKDATDSDAADANGCTGPITLSAGESDLAWDAGLVRTEVVSEPAALGDTVWADTNSNGQQDETGTGVQGVVVNLKQGGTIIFTKTTDADGKYLFDNLTPGTYEVCFVKPTNFNFTVQGPTGSKDATDSDAAESGDATGCTGPITLGSGEEDLSWDAGLVSTTPTSEDQDDQPSNPLSLFLPSVQDNK